MGGLNNSCACSCLLLSTVYPSRCRRCETLPIRYYHPANEGFSHLVLNLNPTLMEMREGMFFDFPYRLFALFLGPTSNIWIYSRQFLSCLNVHVAHSDPISYSDSLKATPSTTRSSISASSSVPLNLSPPPTLMITSSAFDASTAS